MLQCINIHRVSITKILMDHIILKLDFNDQHKKNWILMYQCINNLDINDHQYQ